MNFTAIIICTGKTGCWPPDPITGRYIKFMLMVLSRNQSCLPLSFHTNPPTPGAVRNFN